MATEDFSSTGRKHTSDGIIEGRHVPFTTAIGAVNEMLNLIEVLK
jgi:hypothetical protein